VLFDSTIAKRFCGALGASVNATRPKGFAGNPFVSSFQVLPASVDLYIALPGPPELNE
jgi:hypothetical protein